MDPYAKHGMWAKREFRMKNCPFTRDPLGAARRRFQKTVDDIVHHMTTGSGLRHARKFSGPDPKLPAHLQAHSTNVSRSDVVALIANAN